MTTHKLIVVGQQDGDVGKTTTAIFLAEMYHAVGRQFLVLDADDKHQTAPGQSALAHALPRHTVVWLGTGPSVSAQASDADAVNIHWDKVRAVLDQHDVILDLGANTVQRLLEYAIQNDAATFWPEEGIEVEFWVPVLNDRGSIESGLEALEMAGKAFGKAALRAVRNHRKGSDFDKWNGSPVGKAMSAMERAGVLFLDMPKAEIPLAGLNAMDSGPWSAFQIRDMGRLSVAETLGLGDEQRQVATRTYLGCVRWIESVAQSWGHVVPGGNA